MRPNRLTWILVLILAAACSPGNFLSPAQPTIAPQALTLAAVASTPAASFTPTLTAEPTSTLTQTATITPTLTTEPSPTAYVEPTLISKDSPDPQACGFNWARQERPELSEKIQGALEEKGFADIIVRASDYGENCVAYDTGVVQYFMAMNTDFYITFPVESTARDILSRHVFDLMMGLNQAWSEVTSEGIARGEVELTFVLETVVSYDL